jgi:hypothetical protein
VTKEAHRTNIQGGCATGGSSVTACADRAKILDKFASYKSIGVISAVGGEITTVYKSGVSFTHSEKVIASRTDKSWRIDEFVTEIVADQLKDRFDVKPVAYLRDVFAAHYPLDTIDFPNDLAPPLGPLIQTVITAQPLDAYLVIRPGWGELGSCTYGAYTNCFHYFGLGLRRQFVILRSDKVQVYADFLVSVVDARTGEVFGTREVLGTTRVSDNSMDVDETWWADSFDQMTPQQRLQLQDAFKRILADALPKALRNIGIIH